jgi:hypothetical protein
LEGTVGATSVGGADVSWKEKREHRFRNRIEETQKHGERKKGNTERGKKETQKHG